MKKPSTLKSLLFVLSLFVSGHLFSQAANGTCATATVLPAVTGDCSSTQTAGDLYLANQTNPTGGCGNRYDVWYRFTVPVSSAFVTITVTLTSNPSSIATNNTYIELFNTSTCTINGTMIGGCNDISSPRRYTGLTGGGTYYFRVATTVNPNANPTRWGFNVCVTSNDNCTTSTQITPGGTVMDGSVFGATNTGIAAPPCSADPDDDVWYRFTAPYSYATITLHNVGVSLSGSGSRMQIFSGTCGTLTSIGCATSGNVMNMTTLTPGNTYYVRVYSGGTTQAGFTANGSVFRISVSPSAPVVVGSGRMKEVYHQQILSSPQVLADPWEVTFGPDSMLWITESKGYRIYRMNTTTGVRDTILDITQGSTFLSDNTYNVQANVISNGPQGGLAGLAIHPRFMSTTAPRKLVYVSYIYSFQSNTDPNGVFYTNRVVGFRFNTSTQKLDSPFVICDTLPGSNDHNSQRMIIAPVGGNPYLFYAAGDMGGGQFANRLRPQKAQNPAAYEGKILRFNLETDGDAGMSGYIPNDNPYSATSAVWCIGIRNNQGFAYDSVANLLYGSSHGPYSDDELNIIDSLKNYGHPLVIGYAADGNYNGTTTPGLNTSVSAGAPFSTSTGNSSCPPVGNETTNVATINASGTGTYRDPLYTAYAGPVSGAGSVANIWATTTGANANWPSEGWSGLDIYTHTLVPGWKKSLVAGSLKWGRLVKMKLDAAGTAIVATDGADTVSYFGGTNRFRDLAIAPNGKDIYVIMDRSATTSGPSAANPVVPACGGCVQKYSFLGYADAAGKSSIPTAIDVTSGTPNLVCNPGTTVTIDATNNNLWVPITGPDGNIMAEINANGQNLGVVTSSFYQHSGAIRIKNGARYLNRNITITPANAPGSAVKVRLYFSKAEYDALDLDGMSGVSSIGDVKILKNSDPCGAAVVAATTMINPTFAEAHGANGYMLQGDITGFSSFYFGSANLTLPLQLLSFTGTLQPDNTVLLKWKTENETNTSHFVVERSIDGSNFSSIGTVSAAGTSTTTLNYSLPDNNAADQLSNILYYRLRSVDTDASFKYSNIVTITLGHLTGKVIVSPNPVEDIARVTAFTTADGKLYWSLLDNAGRVLRQDAVMVHKGSNSFTIQMNNLAAGTYYLKVSGAGIDQKIKVQKL